MCCFSALCDGICLPLLSFTKQVAYVSRFKEQVAIQGDYHTCRHEQNERFHAFGGWGHSHFFLQKINKEVEDDTCKDTAVILNVYPSHIL
jgi:hypothetical protein